MDSRKKGRGSRNQKTGAWRKAFVASRSCGSASCLQNNRHDAAQRFQGHANLLLSLLSNHIIQSIINFPEAITEAIFAAIIATYASLIAFGTAILSNNSKIKIYVNKNVWPILIIFATLIVSTGLVTYFINVASHNAVAANDEIEIIGIDTSDPTTLDVDVRNISNNDIVINTVSVESVGGDQTRRGGRITMPAMRSDISATWSADIQENSTDTPFENLQNKPLHFLVKAHMADRFRVKLNAANWQTTLLSLYYGVDNVVTRKINNTHPIPTTGNQPSISSSTPTQPQLGASTHITQYKTPTPTGSTDRNLHILQLQILEFPIPLYHEIYTVI